MITESIIKSALENGEIPRSQAIYGTGPGETRRWDNKDSVYVVQDIFEGVSSLQSVCDFNVSNVCLLVPMYNYLLMHRENFEDLTLIEFIKSIKDESGNRIVSYIGFDRRLTGTGVAGTNRVLFIETGSVSYAAIEIYDV